MTAEIGEYAFLGEEFLTWLWFRCETRRGLFRMPDGTEVGVAIEDYLCLGGSSEHETENTLRNGLPTRAPEARAALLSGKRLARARLTFAEHDEQWSFVLHGATLDLASVRCPDVDHSDYVDDPAGEDCERISKFTRLTELVDGVYRQFLRERLREDYRSQTLDEMRRWAEAKNA